MTSNDGHKSFCVFRWVLDVQSEWSYPDDIPSGRDATSQWALGNEVAFALDLLPAHERKKVLQFYHIRDAKLSLGSQLLKHCAIVRTCSTPWAESIVSRDHNGKPCYIPKDDSEKRVEFNVSHHGSLVALAGCIGENIQVGVDVVQIDLDKDVPKVRQEGWRSWVSTYAAVFSDREVQDIVSWVPSEPLDEIMTHKAKLRHFYAHWCLKEAYVKMTGEALMAPWLQDMEFRNVEAPRAASELMMMMTDQGSDWGEIYAGVEVWHQGRQLTQMKMELQAFRSNYMIGTAASFPDASFLPCKILDLQQDVYSAAEIQ
ncbi:MAG: hypothetical protein Q9219_005150 [cf. Caloplaca sp. 3 TL-2023]